jgi:hypothetical protein
MTVPVAAAPLPKCLHDAGGNQSTRADASEREKVDNRLGIKLLWPEVARHHHFRKSRS